MRTVSAPAFIKRRDFQFSRSGCSFQQGHQLADALVMRVTGQRERDIAEEGLTWFDDEFSRVERVHEENESTPLELQGLPGMVRFRKRCQPRNRRICLSRPLLLLAGVFSLLVYSPCVRAEPATLPPEVGHNYAELETPRMTALGGPMRATSNSLSALYSNPANMAAAQVYHVGATVQLYPESRRQSYGGAVVDSLISSSGIAGGVGGTWSFQDPDGINRSWMDLRFGLAMPLGEMFFLGVTGKYITLQQNGVGPLGASKASGGLEKTNIIQTVSFDAGLTLRPVPEFSIAITGTNLSNPDTNLFPIMGGVGMGYTSADFSLTADAAMEGRTYEGVKLRVNGGGEFLIADRVAIRAGYRFDQGMRSHAISGGLGYVDQKFSVDASLRKSVNGPNYVAIVFGFKVHIESMSLGSSSPDAY